MFAQYTAGMDRIFGKRAKAIAAEISVAGTLGAIANIDRTYHPSILEEVSSAIDVVRLEVNPIKTGHLIARTVSLNEPLVLGGIGALTAVLVYSAEKRKKTLRKPQLPRTG